MCNKNLSRDLAVAMRDGTVRIDPPRTTAFSVNKVLLRSLADAMRDGETSIIAPLYEADGDREL